MPFVPLQTDKRLPKIPIRKRGQNEDCKEFGFELPGKKVTRAKKEDLLNGTVLLKSPTPGQNHERKIGKLDRREFHSCLRRATLALGASAEKERNVFPKLFQTFRYVRMNTVKTLKTRISTGKEVRFWTISEGVGINSALWTGY